MINRDAIWTRLRGGGLRTYLLTIAIALANSAAVIMAAPRSPFSFSFVFILPAVFFSLFYWGLRRAVLSVVVVAFVAEFFLLHGGVERETFFHGTIRNAFFVVVLGTACWLIDKARGHGEAKIQMPGELLNVTPEPVLLLDQNRQIVFWNRGAEMLYGWSAEEAQGKRPEDLLKTIYPEGHADPFKELKDSDRFQCRLTHTAKDGREVVVQSMWLRLKDFVLGGMFLQADMDLSEQIRVENEFRRANRALKALSATNHALIHADNEKELFHSVIDIIARECRYPLAWVGLKEKGSDCTVTETACAGDAYAGFQNTLAARRTLDGQGPAGRALRTGEPCLVPDLKGIQSKAWRDFATGAELRSGLGLPLKVDGNVLGVLAVYSHHLNAFVDAEVEFLMELAADLSFGVKTLRERKQAEAERKLNVLLEDQLRQAQKMEAVGRLAGGIAHDFNNLLMIITGQTELLLESKVSPEAERRVREILEAAKRGANLTQQLLAFSRKQVLQPTVLDLNLVVRGVYSMLERVLGKDINLQLVLTENPAVVKMDRMQLEQILMNLVINARDAMPNGGTLTIETAHEEIKDDYVFTQPMVLPGRYSVLSVRDTGIGMDRATQSKIFEPFFTTKEQGKGTGLGLATVYGIVKQSGAGIRVSSKVGEGTCFKIYMPVVDAAVESERASEKPAVEQPKATTVLLVEDEPGPREIVSQFLSKAGYEVLVAESVDTAIETAMSNRDRIKLLLTDLALKGGNGKLLADSLKEKGCNFAQLFMSGYTQDLIVHEGQLNPDTHFLQKPFTRTALLDKVSEVIQSRV